MKSVQIRSYFWSVFGHYLRSDTSWKYIIWWQRSSWFHKKIKVFFDEFSQILLSKIIGQHKKILWILWKIKYFSEFFALLVGLTTKMLYKNDEKINQYLKKPDALAQRCSVKKMFFEFSQNSEVSTCTRISFLIKLQAWGLQLYYKRNSSTCVFLWILQNF